MQAAKTWKSSVDMKRVREQTAELPDFVSLGEMNDLPLQHLKKKLKNVPLFKDFLLQADIDGICFYRQR